MKCQIVFAFTGMCSNNIILSKEPGELRCSRSNSAAKYRKEDFFLFFFWHYKKTFLCCEGHLWGLENPLPLICWVTLDKSLSLSALISPSLSELPMYLGFKVFGAGTDFCCVLHSTHHQEHWKPAGGLGNTLLFFEVCVTLLYMPFFQRDIQRKTPCKLPPVGMELRARTSLQICARKNTLKIIFPQVNYEYSSVQTMSSHFTAVFTQKFGLTVLAIPDQWVFAETQQL